MNGPALLAPTFYYEDVSGRGITEDTHELVSEDDTYYVVRSTPKNAEIR